MATRRDIKDALYDELVSKVARTYTVTYDDGTTEDVTIDSGDIDLIGPEYQEREPAVFYQPQTFRHVEYNGVGNAPSHVEKVGGTTEYIEWREYVEGQFFVYVRGDSPAVEEPIYERLRSVLAAYDSGIFVESNMHEDVSDINVVTSSPSNSLDQKPAIWGSQIEVHIEFVRRLIVESGGTLTMEEAVDNLPVIEQIDFELDTDDDGTTEYTQTVT